MKNGFLNKQPQRMLFSTVMFASLFAVSPFTAVAETMEMQTVMQSGQISGQVVDGTGEPVIGASVLVKGTSMVRLLILTGNSSCRMPLGLWSFLI